MIQTNWPPLHLGSLAWLMTSVQAADQSDTPLIDERMNLLSKSTIMTWGNVDPAL